MKITAAVGVLFLLFVSSPSHAACDVKLRAVASPTPGGPLTLIWDPVPGAVNYQVQESLDEMRTSRNYFVTTSTFTISRRSTTVRRIDYLVTAHLSPGTQSVNQTVLPLAEACTGSITLNLPADAALRRLTRKGVIPLVGSAAGAFDSRFKTQLTLTATDGNQHGLIVFHPAGAQARDTDPSLRYSFSEVGEVIVYDDVVTRMGRTGIGTLDIIPDEDASQEVPDGEARLFNETAGGTFGTYESIVYPREYLTAPSMNVSVPDSRFRLNLGVRTFSDTPVRVLVFGTNHRLRVFFDLFFPSDLMTMGSIDQFLGRSVAQGETVTLIFNGAAIPFYTVTENRTNDPALFIVHEPQSNNIGSYVQ